MPSMRRTRRRGGSSPSPAPLSKVNTYTSWPGGIDPTVRLYNQASMLGGTWKKRTSRTRKQTRRRR